METTTLESKAYLASSNFGPATKPETILAGADLVKGTVLGRVTATGKMKAYAAGSSDGSENPVAILWTDAAAAAEDVEAECAFAGVYKEDSMTGLDAAAITALEARAIYFK
jgi:Bacteriophage lambda head decoration protein D